MRRDSRATTRITAFVTCWIVLAASAIPRATTPIIFKKVDTFTMVGDEEKKHDARMELDVENKVLRVTDEKRGAEKMTYAEIPYEAITGLSYSRSSHPRSAAGTALGVASLGVGLLVGFLARNKKHWFTIDFNGVESLPQNYLYLRLDKSNFRQIMAAVEAATGLETEVFEEG